MKCCEICRRLVYNCYVTIFCQCDAGLWASDGSEECTVIQIRLGTNPLGGSFTLDLDSRSPTA